MKKGLSRKKKIGLYTFLAAVGVAIVGSLGLGNKQRAKEETKSIKPTVEQTTSKSDTVRHVYGAKNGGFVTAEPQTVHQLELTIRMQTEMLKNIEEELGDPNLNPERRTDVERSKRSIVIKRAEYKRRLAKLQKAQMQQKQNSGARR